MGRLIVIEGLDGFGKTTVAEELAKRGGFKYIKAETGAFKSLTDEKKKKMHPMRRFLFYLSAYTDVSEQVRLSGNETFVTDRYISSMQVYNGKLVGRDLTSLIQEFDLLAPDVQIMLVGDENSRYERTETRDKVKSDWDKKIQKDKAVRDELKERYFRFCEGSSIVLNTDRELSDTLDEISSIVRGEYVDMHVHSAIVDGTMSPKQIVELAAQKKLKAVALLDHDTIDGVPEALHYGERLGVEVIPGVEVSAKEFGYNVHILGYFLNPNDEKLVELLKEQREIRKKALEEKCEDLRDLGFDVSSLDVYVESPQRFIGKKNIAYNILNNPANRVLVEQYIGKVEDMSRAVSMLKDAVFEVEDAPLKRCKTPAVTITDTIDAIHSAGGLTFVAHPYKKLNEKTMDRDLEFLQQLSIDGIECITSGHSPEQTAHLLIQANRLGLLVCGGSNYHKGWDKKYSDVGQIELGFGINRNIHVPYYFVEKMKERLR